MSPRPSSNPGQPNVPLAVACLLLGIVAAMPPLTPLNWLTDHLASVVRTATIPGVWLIDQLHISSRPDTPSEERLKLLTDERDRFKTLYLQEQEQRLRLEGVVRMLNKGRSLGGEEGYFLLQVPVLGYASDASSPMLRLKAGTSDGVDTTSIGTTDGVDLVGRVDRADRTLSTLRPTIDKAIGDLVGIIFPGESANAPPTPDSPSRVCKLSPTGKGTLSGSVEAPSSRSGLSVSSAPIERGMLVRLRDNAWPEHAQMLVVGEVIDVNNAGARPFITVRPRYELPVGQLVLRVARPRQEAPR